MRLHRVTPYGLCRTLLLLSATAGLALSASAQTATTGTTEADRRESLSQASLADDYRETLAANSPAPYYRELEGTSARGRRSRRPLPSSFVATSATLSGPMGHQPLGCLSGKIIFCSAGHGWTHETTSGMWYTQRPLSFGVVEDLGNIDQLNFFADLCFRAGATVVPMRPLGHQSLERIVDNSHSNARFQGTWYDSGSTIYYGGIHERVPYRFAVASREETAVARFQPYLPKSDFYPVYCWARDGADRVNQTYRIVHSGGATEIGINHRRVGKGWVYLGEYYFDKGQENYVEITNKVADPYEADGKHVVIADAVRFGNGMGDVNRGSGVSGAPREEEASRYWVEASLAKDVAPIYDARENDDQASNVGTPARMASHMNREREGSYFDRLYLGFHSNAVGGRGTVGLFEQSPELRPDHQVEWAQMIARQFNEDLTTTGFAHLPVAWAVARKLTDSHIDFGEIRRDYLNNEMVATISEVAYHDNPLDAVLLRSPQARLAMALSSYKAVLKYFAHFQPAAAPITLLPEPPTQLATRPGETTSSIELVWSAPASPAIRAGAPSAYVVYHSLNGYGFDGGVRVEGATSYEVPDLPAGVTHFFRVTSVNAGGESAPSATLPVTRQTTETAQADLLLVCPSSTLNDDKVLTETVQANLGAPFRSGGDVVRILPRLTSLVPKAVETGKALGEASLSFDSCTLDAFTSGMSSVFNYPSIVMADSERPGPLLLSEDLQTSVGEALRF